MAVGLDRNDWRHWDHGRRGVVAKPILDSAGRACCRPRRWRFHACGHGVGSFRRVSDGQRSEEHTSELQSLMRISYAVFCLKKKKYIAHNTSDSTTPIYSLF